MQMIAYKGGSLHVDPLVHDRFPIYNISIKINELVQGAMLGYPCIIKYYFFTCLELHAKIKKNKNRSIKINTF
jgi:hypothetical protein